jgi:hypothetical protein
LCPVMADYVEFRLQHWKKIIYIVYFPQGFLAIYVFEQH